MYTIIHLVNTRLHHNSAQSARAPEYLQILSGNNSSSDAVPYPHYAASSPPQPPICHPRPLRIVRFMTPQNYEILDIAEMNTHLRNFHAK